MQIKSKPQYRVFWLLVVVVGVLLIWDGSAVADEPKVQDWMIGPFVRPSEINPLIKINQS